MTRENTRDNERVAAEMVQKREDESVEYLISALLDLEQQDVEQRVNLLVSLGYRYLLLALAREEGRDPSAGETVDVLLDNRLAHSLTLQPPSTHQTPDEMKMIEAWFSEAIANLSSAIQQAATTPYTAVATRAVASARLGRYQDAIADLQIAATLAATPLQQAEIFYWRGGILVELQLTVHALQEFSQARQICSDVQKFIDAAHLAWTRWQIPS